MSASDWKSIALYLADCHAATADHDGMLKSCSTIRRERFASICEKAMALIDGRNVPYSIDERRVMDRLAGAVLRLKVGA